MSQGNVEVATQAIEAFNRVDVDGFAGLTTADFEWSPSMVAIEGTIFHGREGIESYFRSLYNAWEKFHIHRDRFRTGVLFAIYLLYAGTERFLVEFLRRNDSVALGLTTAQLESLAMMVGGIAWIYVVKRRHGNLGRASGTTAVALET